MTTTEPKCPKCMGPCWDNRTTKRNPRAPNFKCKDRSCDGAIWEDAKPSVAPGTAKEAHSAGPHIPGLDDALPPEKLDKIFAASALCLDHVLSSDLPKLAKVEIGASDAYIQKRVDTLLIAAQRAGAC